MIKPRERPGEPRLLSYRDLCSACDEYLWASNLSILGFPDPDPDLEDEPVWDVLEILSAAKTIVSRLREFCSELHAAIKLTDNDRLKEETP